METIKQEVVYLFFTHVFLRRIGKKYPEFFKSWVNDCVENARERKILIMRYTGESKMKFSAIALELNMDESNLFKYHKKAVMRMIAN